MEICFATNNRHKLEEVTAVLGNDFRIVTLHEIGCTQDLPETQNSISGNAVQKARFVWDRFSIPCFADDSGLEVDALGGRPGVDSAHFAGPQRNSDDNIGLLLRELQGVPDRTARFRTVISLCLPEGEWMFEGILSGSILTAKRGTGGFGYDPVFLPEGSEKTLAEMTLEEKNKISHRGIAVGKLGSFLMQHKMAIKH
jgi:XTP/dITP diphosphohydrolase